MTEKINNSLVIKNVEKKFDDVIALNKISLKVSEGEFCTLLGASGSGKTTLLRVIAGFEPIDNGSIQINGKNVETLSIANRNIGMVFQNYALFPHMSVRENIAFGLKMRKLNKTTIEKKTNEALSLVNLINEAERFPSQLSGGQQQRVQLARALILENDVLLLDEPLSALDAQLRKDMCIELKRLQKTVGISFVHVTHNQEEALSVADRIAIIADGEMIEQGTPEEIYSTPKNKFTAEFIGEKNILHGKITTINKNNIFVDIEQDMIEISNKNYNVSKNQSVSLSIKSESIELKKHASAKLTNKNKNSIFGKVTEITFLGQFVRYLVILKNGQEIQVRSVEKISNLKLNDEVLLNWNKTDLLLHTK